MKWSVKLYEKETIDYDLPRELAQLFKCQILVVIGFVIFPFVEDPQTYFKVLEMQEESNNRVFSMLTNFIITEFDLAKLLFEKVRQLRQNIVPVIYEVNVSVVTWILAVLNASMMT